LYDLGWAKRATGNPAAALSNIGHVYDGLGERQRALEYYGQALPIRREVANRAGEAVTRYNLAMLHRTQGDLGRAVAELWSRWSSWTARSATPTCNPTPKCSSKSARSC
jgi:tetratricopeptide (TPR) repeat protein